MIHKHVVSGSEGGVRLLDILKAHVPLQLSLREWKGRLEKGSCQVNGQIERFASKRVSEGDRVHFDDKGAGQPLMHVKFEKERILYEDEWYLAYDKPPGISCDEKGIVALLGGYHKLLMTHRIDKDTSGALLFAKNREAEQAMMEAFRQRRVIKEYLALVDGHMTGLEGVIENYLGKIGSYQGQTIYGKVPRDKGQIAKTSWKLVKQSNKASLVSCFPTTGRTHQLRVHLAGLGHPILGDLQYGKRFRCSIKAPRMMLHALKLSFPHPVKKDIIDILSPVPNDLKEMLKELW